jgi:hypothetical protein
MPQVDGILYGCDMVFNLISIGGGEYEFSLQVGLIGQ